MNTGLKAGIYFIGWCLFMALFLAIEGPNSQINLGFTALSALIAVILLGVSVPKLNKAVASPPKSRLGYNLRIVYFLILAVGTVAIIVGSVYVAFLGHLTYADSGIVSATLFPFVIALLLSISRLATQKKNRVFAKP